MKRLILSILAIAAMALSAHANVLLEYTFDSFDGAATTVEPDFFGIFFRRDKPITTDFSGGFATSNTWATIQPAVGSDPTGDFYKFSVSNFTGAQGCDYVITSVVFDARTSDGGPNAYSLESDFNNLTPPVGTGDPELTWQTFTVDTDITINHGDTRLFYLYGLGATDDLANFDVDNVIINGYCIPETATYATVLSGAFILFYVVRRKKMSVA